MRQGVRETLASAARRLTSPTISWPGGIVSFTFDDFPRSALETGGRILEAHGVRGTYYAAWGLVGTEGDLGPLFRRDDLEAAAGGGHEIGCHTLTHLDCARAEGRQLAQEAEANGAALRRAVGGERPASFAFPFGSVSARARRVMRRRFATCRGIQPGLNAGPVDRSELRANKLYARSFDPGAVRRLVEENRKRGGWLIFYTHDVRANPSPFGCAPSQLAWTVDYAAGRSAVMTVGAAARRLGIG
jgi:peptidoglycan/xylan/chitin deacetylase (PgdA/CDA1 family)